MVVLPDGERVEHALVEAAREAQGFVDGSDYLTFGQLIASFDGAGRLGRRTCTPLTARVVVWACARELGEGPFGAFVHEPAFARAALELILDLKAGGLSARAFHSAVAQLPALRRERAKFLADLYGRYEDRMAQLKLADREDLGRGALSSLEGGLLPQAFGGTQLLTLAGLHDFPPLRRELLLRLAQAFERAGKRMVIRLPGAGSRWVDGPVDGLCAHFERHAQELTSVELSKEDYAGLRRPLAPLGGQLFSPDSSPGALAGLSGLNLVSAPTSRDEARLLARLAYERIRQGCPPERLAIAYRDLGTEAEWVVEALEELGVPARARRGAPLSNTTVGRLALELPLVVDDEFPADAVAHLLGSRYVPEVSGGAPAAPASLIARAGIRDDRVGAEEGRGAYQVRLEQLATRLANRGAATAAADVWALLRRVSRLMAVGRQIPAQDRASKLLERWWGCVRELGILRAARQLEPREPESTTFGRAVLRSLARDQAAAEALQAMVGELDAALRLSGAASISMPRRTFARWLGDAALDFNLVPRGPRGGAVRVLDVREMAGLSFDHVLLGGVCEGRFPGPPSTHALFPDEDRAAVNAHARREVFRTGAGEGDGRVPWGLGEDRLLFYVALTSAEQGATVSYARQGATGHEQVPSVFVSELVRLTGVPVEARPRLPTPSLDDVATERELRERVALEVLARPQMRSTPVDPARGALLARLGGEGWFARCAHLSAVEEERLAFFSSEARPAGPYSGQVSDPSVLAALRAAFRFGPERPLSASALQRFGNCHFQGLLAHLFRLEEPEEAGEEIDARGQGSYWHGVLEALFPALAAQGLLGAGIEDLPPQVVEEALAAGSRAVSQWAHVGHPALWRLAREKARGMTLRVLSGEVRGLPFPGHTPQEVELRFGRPNAKEGWREVAIPGTQDEGDVFVEGKIDRLDAAGLGVGVLDYKSSRLASADKAFEKLLTSEFQLALYLHAARSAGASALRAAWLSLRDGAPLELTDVLSRNGQTLDELLATDPASRARLLAEGKKNLPNAVHALASKLRAGQFPMRAQDCTHCAFGAVCRVTGRRVEESGDE